MDANTMPMGNTGKSFWDGNKGWIIPLVVIVAVVGWGVAKYNSFVRGNTAIDGQWAQVENQLQRRFDLIPNLVNTVKGLTTQEQKVFGEIADARTHYAGATTPDAKAAAATEVEGALGRLLVITENYPTLQSSQAFRDLMVSLEGTENRISVERMNYNNLVQSFNASVQTFPNSLFASLFGFHVRTYFEVPASNQVVPTVDFTK
jgi:LemA protein